MANILAENQEAKRYRFRRTGPCVADFDPGDFFNPDLHTTAKNKGSYTTWFLYCLNEYFYREDTNRDLNGEGTLTRLLGSLGAEIDENIIPYIECFLNMIDPQTTTTEFLTIVSSTLGSPPNITFDEDSYRNLLTYIVNIYKLKGTKKSFEMFFAILGYDIELIEIKPDRIIINYDDAGKYDTTGIYDSSACVPCSYYDIKLIPKHSVVQLTDDIIKRMLSAIEFIEPINVRLRHLIYNLKLSDRVRVTIKDEPVDIYEKELINYDTNYIYDDGYNYEENSNELEILSIVPMTLETSNTAGVLTMLIKFDRIHEIENNKQYISVDIIKYNADMVRIGSIPTNVTNLSNNLMLDTYTVNLNNNLDNAVYYRVQINILLNNGLKAISKADYTNIDSDYTEIINLNFN